MAKRRLKAEMWDKMQYLFRNYYDCTVHSVFYFDGTIDEKALGEVLLGILQKVPVLHSSFQDRFVKPFWKVNRKFNLEDFFELVVTEEPVEYLNGFITLPIIATDKLQIRVRVIRSHGKDTLAMLTNHMCFDGGDLFYFTKKIVENYNNYKKTGELTIDIKQGTRAADQVYKDMPFTEKLKAKVLFKNVSEVKGKTTFPYTDDALDDSPRLILHKVDSSVFNEAKAKGKKFNASMNDIFLAAYFKTLFDICTIDPAADNSITIPSMINLRKYMLEKDTLGLTNMTGFMPCTVKKEPADDMTRTIIKVMKSLERSKADEHNGLYSLPLLKLAYGILPQKLAEVAIKLGYQNPLIGMSNIGPINPDNYTLEGGIKAVDAWFSGAIKFKPYIQVALTTFNGDITFSVGFRGNDEDEKTVRAMLESIESYLRKFIVEDSEWAE